MAAVQLPIEVQNTLEAVTAYDGTDLFNDVVTLTRVEKTLTEKLCCSDTVDFVMVDDGMAYQFTANDQTGEWTVEQIEVPVF
jgi:hypothetical protein